MEWYGKVYCITADELTRDDRTAMDSSELLAPIMNKAGYHKLCQRNSIKVVRRGGGKGCPALIAVDSLPEAIRERVKARYGEGERSPLHTHFLGAYSHDYKAQGYYTRELTKRNLAVSAERLERLIDEYTTNASVLQTLLRLKEDTTLYRRVRQGRACSWAELVSVSSFYREEYGHTLPTTAVRLARVANSFLAEGYEALVSKKFGNSNTRKVSIKVEQLLMQINFDKTRPYDSTVWQWYCEFLAGKRTIINKATGEEYNPDEYPDISEKTVGDVLGKVLNEARASKHHDARHDYMTRERAHANRIRPKYSLSLVSLDDKDMAVKVRWCREVTKQVRGESKTTKVWETTSLKAYLCYDVASRAIIGWAFSGEKKEDLFLSCLRSMYRNLLSLGLGQPHEAQVENHLVSKHKDGMMADRALFPAIWWCGAENSQEKFAERENRDFKYQIEKPALGNVGRHYNRLAKNRTSNKKANDAENNNYVQDVWEFDAAVELYEELIQRWNNAPHPDQKLYPNMTRQEVLMSCVHAEIQPIDTMILGKWLGGQSHATITRGQVKLRGEVFGLSTPEVLERLRGRDTKVEATWWEQTEGDIPEVYLWQDARLIDCCPRIERFQVARLERTEADSERIAQERQRIRDWDAAVAAMEVDPIMQMSTEHLRAVEHKPIGKVAMPLDGSMLLTETDEEDDTTYIYHPTDGAARGMHDL